MAPVTIDEFCANPTPIADAPLPSAELGNVFTFYTFENGYNRYNLVQLPVFDPPDFFGQDRPFSTDLPAIATADPAYVGCLRMQPTGRDITCRGYDNGISLKLWGQDTDVKVYEIATAELVAEFMAPDVDNPSCPFFTDGSSEFQETSPWHLRRALVDLAVQGQPTLLGAYVDIDDADGWCGTPTPIDGTTARVIDETATTSPEPLQVMFTGADVVILPPDDSPVVYADRLSEVDYVACLSFVADEADPTVSCEYEGRISYDVDNGRLSVSVVDPVTAEIVATADFASTPRCPGVLVGPAPTDALPGIEASFYDWFTTISA